MLSLILSTVLVVGGIQDTERAAALALVPDSAVDAVSVQSGEWDDPETWGGLPPVDGDDVLISEDTIVLIDSRLDTRLHTIRVDGELEFAPTEDTRLLVETIVVNQEGSLGVGSPVSPILASAEIVFTDDGPVEASLSRGLVSLGMLSIHGEPKSPWGYLAESPVAGDSSVTLGAEPQGWEVGDRLLIPGVSRTASQDEVRTIAGIAGAEVSFSSPLSFDHLTPSGEDSIRLPVGNLTRNVRLSSESPAIDRRGHVMQMHHAEDVSVSFASFVGLGRTNKAVPISGANPRGRYSLHFHRCDKATEIPVQGVVVEDSPGWGLTNHSSNVRAVDSISFSVFGAGFVTEAGDEIGAFERCLALRSIGSGKTRDARKDIGDFGHGGHGFWMQGAQVEVNDCVAGGHRDAALFTFVRGFIEPDTEVVADPSSHLKPLAEYARNTGFVSGFSHSFEWVQPSEATAVFDLLTWGCTQGALIRQAKIDFEGGLFLGTGSGLGIGYVTGYKAQGSVRGATVTGWTTGCSVPITGPTEIMGGTWANTRDFLVIPGTDTSAVFSGFPLEDSTFDFVFNPLTLSALHVRPRSYFFGSRRLYFPQQAPDFVPYQTGTYTGLTNQQIFDQYGKLPLGAIVPVGSDEYSNFFLGP